MKKDEIISGAIYDFMGWLTTRKERLILSYSDNAVPAADAVHDFLKLRNISDDNPDVRNWNNIND